MPHPQPEVASAIVWPDWPLQQVPAVPRRVPDEAELVELGVARLVGPEVVVPVPDLPRAPAQREAHGPEGPVRVAARHDEVGGHEEVAVGELEGDQGFEDEVVLGLEPLPDEAEVPPAWKSNSELGSPNQTSELSSSVKSTSIRLIFGRLDGSRRGLEARSKRLVQTVRVRAH